MRVFKTEIKSIDINYNGQVRSIKAQIIYAWEDDELSPDFDYGDATENAKELARFESGELSNLCLKVSALALGEIDTDWLGGCFVATATLEDSLLEVANEYDMVKTACLELKANILCQYRIMKEALEVA